jgi:uncharacterized membrane protein
MSRVRALAFSAAGGALAAMLIANIAFADDRGFGGGGGFGRRHRGDGMMFFFPFPLLIAAAALVFVLWRGRHPVSPVATAPASRAPSPTFNAEAILADRLARGEIGPDDYRAAITALRETPPPAS